MHALGTSRVLAAALVAGLLSGSARATWSIVVADTKTGEVAIGSGTCLLDFELKRFLPRLRGGQGAGASQSMVDSNAANRIRIWNGLIDGEAPPSILAALAAQDTNHQRRQYGIVDVAGRALTFTGSLAGAYAGGVTGKSGTMVYAIQGNVLTGEPVVSLAEQALLTTPGGIPEKLMAAMEAAREMGGDGRCSCSSLDPTSCGAPPPSFTKSAHIGFMIVARHGDVDGTCSVSPGCASGQYYMMFNILANQASQPDPVLQMRPLFDAWRATLIGIPDQVESIVTMDPPAVLNTGSATARLTVDVRDWRGEPAEGVTMVIAYPKPGTTSTVSIPRPISPHVFEFDVVGGTLPRVDEFVVAVLSGPVVRELMPGARLRVQDAAADLNGDGVVSPADLAILLAAFGGPGGDINGDGVTNQVDLGILLANLPD